jgi:hypothetical protein
MFLLIMSILTIAPGIIIFLYLLLPVLKEANTGEDVIQVLRIALSIPLCNLTIWLVGHLLKFLLKTLLPPIWKVGIQQWLN